MAIIVFLASMISICVRFSDKIIEVMIGVVLGNLHIEDWMTYITTLGGCCYCPEVVSAGSLGGYFADSNKKTRSE